MLNIQGTIHTISTPWVMGIINCTPDSFFAESRAVTAEAAATQAQKMLEEGARILDLGAYSSRPGADHVTEDEEWARLEAVIPVSASRNGRISRDLYFYRYLPQWCSTESIVRWGAHDQ